MTELHCRSCQARTTNGLALCELCRRKVATDLEFLPTYFRNLARWRPGRAGSRPVPRSREPQLASCASDRVSRALDAAGNALTTWVRNLTEDRPQLLTPSPQEGIFADLTALEEEESIRVICAGLERWLTTISTLEWCGVFVQEIGDHEETLRALTEAVAPGWYAGACGQCGSPTYVVRGLTWVACRGCGATTHAADHLETVLTEARDWVSTPVRIAEALVCLIEDETSIDDLRKRIAIWGQRGRLTPIVHTETVGGISIERGVKQYRLGDALDVVLESRDRRKVPQ